MLMRERIERIKKEFEKIRAALVAHSPFIASLLFKVRVVATEKVQTAGVDKYGVMYINPDVFLSLPEEKRVFLVAHETLHIAFLHAMRVGNRDGFLWNIAADGIVNYLLELNNIKPMDTSVTLEKIHELIKKKESLEKLKRMSVEEIYKLLIKNVKVIEIHIFGPFSREGGGKGEANEFFSEGKEGDIIQEGDEETYEKAREGSDEAWAAWKENIAKAYITAKTAGRMPGELEEIIRAFLKPKVPWHILLRRALKEHMSKHVIQTWKRPSRKLEGFPGLKRFGMPNIFILVDTSGSMTNKELEQGFSEIYHIARQANSTVFVVQWDAKVQKVNKLRKPSDARMIKVLGRGGTEIREALQWTLKNAKAADIIVIFSDFEIYDINYHTTISLIEKLMRRNFVISISTSREPRFGHVKIMIQVE